MSSDHLQDHNAPIRSQYHFPESITVDHLPFVVMPMRWGSVPTLFSSSLLTDKKTVSDITFVLTFVLISGSHFVSFPCQLSVIFVPTFLLAEKRSLTDRQLTIGLCVILRAEKRHLRPILPYLVLSFLVLPYLIQTKKKKIDRFISFVIV